MLNAHDMLLMACFADENEVDEEDDEDDDDEDEVGLSYLTKNIDVSS